MNIAAGTRLGSYEVVAQIGAGGMGEVYRAHDTKLGRDVAIKVLPANFVNDPERLSRFQHEARMLAALNHANIATIYGLEQCDGVTCLVMELVTGETLAERVRAGPLVIEEALKIAVQIAEALEAAHEKGIIHRDLKPANVKVTPEGKVKVLDFGLAKAFAGEESGSDPSNSPTLSQAATMQGVILGTAAYMSPEQAKGKPVTKATDIWAFGCVLYELLSGQAAFEGDDITEILAAVVRAEPDWNRLPESTPQSIRLLLRRCLRKDRRQRLQDATGVRIEIEDALSAPPAVAIAPQINRNAIWRWTTISGVCCLIVAAIAGLAVWNLKPSPPIPVTRSVFSLPPGQRFPILGQPAVVLSPDGKQLVYVASAGGAQQLYVRSMDSFDAKPVQGTEGATAPFFSPDSRWIGFFAGGKLKKVSISGGATVTLCDAPNPRGGTWGPDDTIALSPGATRGLSVVRAAGGMPQPLTTLKQGEGSHRWPEFLPGAKAVLFNATKFNANLPEAPFALYLLKTGERRDLVQVGMHPRYAPSGHLLYTQGGTLMAMPFDLGRLQVTGAAVPILEGVKQAANTGAAQYSFSDTGALVYIPGGYQEAERSKLVWVDRKGAEQPIAAPEHSFVRPRVSPDGRRVAVAIEESGIQIWIYDLIRETLTRLTFEGTESQDAVWTPDGKRVTFETGGPPGNLFWQPADGSGKAERLATDENVQIPNSWSPDGQVLAFTEASPATGRDMWILRLSDRKPQVFLQTPFSEGAPMFSPDGRWLAYGSDESGRTEIYVQPYPGPGAKWQISTDGGTEPAWNHNGRELFYRQENKMMAVEVTTQPSFSASKPKMLFEGHYSLSTTPSARNYDVSPDGQRFLMVKTVEQEQTTAQINIVLNWFEELKQKVPTGKK